MNRLPRYLGSVVLGAAALLATPALAQFAVIDAANLVQNALSAARALEQIDNQLHQLENEATMLINEARNLTTLPFSIVARLRATLATTNTLIAQARGIAFRLNDARSQFAQNYPEAYAPGISGAQMAADAQQRWLHSLRALETSVGLQAQAAENMAADEDALAQLVDQSQGAIGALQAVQATNQLLALQARQMIQSQQLHLTQDRGTALEDARRVAAEARAREVRRRFQGSGVQYTPQPVDFYGF
jgi:P-type conjugative transfer protein TrbJ